MENLVQKEASLARRGRFPANPRPRAAGSPGSLIIPAERWGGPPGMPGGLSTLRLIGGMGPGFDHPRIEGDLELNDGTPS